MSNVSKSVFEGNHLLLPRINIVEHTHVPMIENERVASLSEVSCRLCTREEDRLRQERRWTHLLEGLGYKLARKPRERNTRSAKRERGGLGLCTPQRDEPRGVLTAWEQLRHCNTHATDSMQEPRPDSGKNKYFS